MKTFTLGAAFAVLVGMAAPVFADHERGGDDVDQRQQRIERRIDRAWQSGELTRREYRHLQHGLREFARAEYAYKSDGWLSAREQSELHARLDALAREVRHERQDAEHRQGAYPYNPAYHAQRRY